MIKLISVILPLIIFHSVIGQSLTLKIGSTTYLKANSHKRFENMTHSPSYGYFGSINGFLPIKPSENSKVTLSPGIGIDFTDVYGHYTGTAYYDQEMYASYDHRIIMLSLPIQVAVDINKLSIIPTFGINWMLKSYNNGYGQYLNFEERYYSDFDNKEDYHSKSKVYGLELRYKLFSVDDLLFDLGLSYQNYPSEEKYDGSFYRKLECLRLGLGLTLQ